MASDESTVPMKNKVNSAVDQNNLALPQYKPSKESLSECISPSDAPSYSSEIDIANLHAAYTRDV
jgi:hypothetical protein